MALFADQRPVIAALRDRLQRRRDDQRFLTLEAFLREADSGSGQAGDLQPYHKTTVDALARALAGLWVHLPFKRARYGVNPTDALGALARNLPMPPGDFSRAVLDIFLDLHDPHTTYQLAEPWASATAFLPFLAARCFTQPVGDAPPVERFVVTQVAGAVAADFAAAGFGPRAVLTHWNGMPIEAVVHAAALRENGANPHACQARAVRNLTIRPLARLLPPDSPAVLLRYIPPGEDDARARELLIEWSVQAERKEGTRQLLFGAPPADDWQSWEGLPIDYRRVEMPHPTSTEPVPVGLLRIRTFDIPRSLFRAQLPALIDHLRELAPLALLIDVRGNAGGEIQNGEFLLQLLAPGPITPASFQFLNTPLVRQLVQTNEPEYADIFGVDRDTGALFSRPGQITSTERANSIGQRYFGRVGLVTDALCYSTTDIFAAGFQDHRMGPVIGVDPTTGGGGANVWHYGAEIAGAKTEDGYEFPPLPLGVDMGVSVRQCLRTGRFHGEILEDFGVSADHLYRPREEDLFDNGQGLYEFAFSKLLWGEGLADVTLDVRVIPPILSSEALTVAARTSGVVRGEIVVDGKTSVVFPADPAGQRWSGKVAVEQNMESVESVEVRGYRILPRAAYPYYGESELAQMEDAEKLAYHLVAARRVIPDQPEWSEDLPFVPDLPSIEYPATGERRRKLLWFVNGATRAAALETLVALDELRKLAPDVEVRVATYGHGARVFAEAGAPCIDLDLPPYPPQYAVVERFHSVWTFVSDFQPLLIVAYEEFEIANCPVLPAPCIWITAGSDRFPNLRHTILLADPGPSDSGDRLTAVGSPTRPLRYWTDAMGEGKPIGDLPTKETIGSTEAALLRARQEARREAGIPLDELLIAVFVDPAGPAELIAPLQSLVQAAFDELDPAGGAFQFHVLTAEGAIERRPFRSKRLLWDLAGFTREGPYFHFSSNQSIMAAADLAIVKGTRGIARELALLAVPVLTIHSGPPVPEPGNFRLFAAGLTASKLLSEMRWVLSGDLRHGRMSAFERQTRPPAGLAGTARALYGQLLEIEQFPAEAERRARQLIAGEVALPPYLGWLQGHLVYRRDAGRWSAISELLWQYCVRSSPNIMVETYVPPALDAETAAELAKLLDA